MLARWSASTRLYALPDGRWLLTGLSETTRAERGPGVPLAGDLEELRHGARIHHDPAALEPIDPAAWLRIEQPVVALEPLDVPPAATTVTPAPAPEQVDVRELARVDRPTAEIERLLAASRPRQRRGLVARLVLRTPAANVLGRRHARYLERLVDAFEAKDYDTALRDAIVLGGAGGGWLSLRLPGRRSGPLRPTPVVGQGGAAPWDTGADVLRELYRKAAEQLEQAGDIERAAFVHADLLRAPRDAVALLERHGLFELAAQLAEGRALDAGLVVRLWWRAGRPGRAIALARSRGAFAAALERIHDPEVAHALRAAWVEAERARGDHRSAVEVAWPDAVLREEIAPDLAAIRALGGRQAATGIALDLAWRADPGVAAEAAALVRDGDPGERLALLAGLAERSPADPTTDHRLASLGVRALLRDGADRRVRGGRPIFNRLRQRADPLLRADLPPFGASEPSDALISVAAEADPGAIAISDAVWLSTGLLVAAGERGLLRLTRDGRVAQRWDVASERLVVADHGGAVLIAGPGEGVTEFHRLDVVSGRVRPWASLPRTPLPQSYDGGVLIVPGPTGLEGIDTTSDPPRVLWNEVGSDGYVLAFTRSATHLAAIVDLPLAGRRRERSIEAWRWELPGRQAFQRDLRTDAWADDPEAAVTADGTVVWMAVETGHRLPLNGATRAEPAGLGAAYVISGDHAAVAHEDTLTLERTFAVVGATRFRVHAGVATVWSDDGRVVCIDLAGREVVANLRIA